MPLGDRGEDPQPASHPSLSPSLDTVSSPLGLEVPSALDPASDDDDEVFGAEGEDEARDWLVAHDGQWDLAVVDLFLAQRSGLGVLRHLRARGPHRRAVVLSNYATPDMRRRCLEAGADAVFDKSNELEDLMAYCEAQANDVSARP